MSSKDVARFVGEAMRNDPRGPGRPANHTVTEQDYQRYLESLNEEV